MDYLSQNFGPACFIGVLYKILQSLNYIFKSGNYWRSAGVLKIDRDFFTNTYKLASVLRNKRGPPLEKNKTIEKIFEFSPPQRCSSSTLPDLLHSFHELPWIFEDGSPSVRNTGLQILGRETWKRVARMVHNRENAKSGRKRERQKKVQVKKISVFVLDIVNPSDTIEKSGFGCFMSYDSRTTPQFLSRHKAYWIFVQCTCVSRGFVNTCVWIFIIFNSYSKSWMNFNFWQG